MFTNYLKSFSTPQAKIGFALSLASAIFYSVVLAYDLLMLQTLAFLFNGAAAIYYVIGTFKKDYFTLDTIQMNATRHLVITLFLFMCGASWLAVAKLVYLGAYLYQSFYKQNN